MADQRASSRTACALRVTQGALLVALIVFSGSLVQAEETASLGSALIEITRRDTPLADRLAAAARVLQSDAELDPEDLARAATALMSEAGETACWLALRAFDSGWVAPGARERLRDALRLAMAAGSHPRYEACLLLTGSQGHVTSSEDPFVRAVLQREFPATGATPETVTLWQLLALATADEPASMRSGLDGLVASKLDAVPFLLHFAKQGLLGTPKGRMPRAARAILALGMIRDRRATPVLAECLFAKDGWVRASAACALGDLGDPAGAVALANYLCTMGDLFRTRDQWDYPGASETSLTPDEWRQIDYFNVDGLAADALLRLGVDNAAGWIIHHKLDLAKQPYRIRVFQDAVDSLRRSLPASPWKACNVDAGYPQRDAAFVALAAWWHAHRDDAALLETRLDETDEGYRTAARTLVERLRGKDVRQFMIVKPACELLGRSITPVLVETLASATRGPALSELAAALSLVRDPRAIEPLIGLLADKRPFVRAAAAKALRTYAGDSAAAREALLVTLSDSKGGPRVAAMSALVAARPSARVRAAIEAHADRKSSTDYRMAETVVRLVQEGEAHWAAIEQGLADERRFTRERWWLLLRHALDLPAWVHDAKAAPDAPFVRRITRERALAALKARRAR